MMPEDVPEDLVLKAAKAVYQAAEHQAERDGSMDSGEWVDWDPEDPFFSHLLIEMRIAMAAVLPSYKQRVTAKYRRFVKAVRVITRGGEAYQTPKSQGGGGDECTISPPELRQALTDLRHGRQ